MAPGQAVTHVGSGDVLDPVGEGRGAGVAVQSAALIQVDQQLVDQVQVEARFEGVAPADVGERVGDLIPVLVGKRRARQCVGHAVTHHVRDRYARRRRVGAGHFEVAAPLETQVVDHRTRQRRIPIGHEDPLLRAVGAVGRDRAVVVGRVRTVRVGGVVVHEVERCRDVVARADLVVELGEGDVLVGGARIDAGQSAQVGVRGSAHRRADPGRTRQRKGRAGCVGHRIHLARAVIGYVIEQLVLEDRAAQAAAELVPLMNRLAIDVLRLGERIERVEVLVAHVGERIAVDRVSARLGYRVHHAARGLAEFGGVVRRADLILANRIQAVHVCPARCAAASL